MIRRFAALLLIVLGCTLMVTAQDAPNAFLEVSATPQTVFVGQRVTYTLKVYSRSERFTLPSPITEGFWLDAEPTRQIINESVNGQQYLVTISTYTLYPLRAGTLSVMSPPVDILDTLFESGVRLDVPPASVTVRALPEPVPSNFSGAVGRFSAARAVSAETLMLGQPLTLVMRISGAGNFETLTRPDLPLPDGWRSYPRPSEAPIVREGIAGVGQRTFEWRLIPDRAGVHIFPAMNIDYFEPDALAYQTVALPEIRVDVLAAPDGTRETKRFDRAALATAFTLKPLTATDTGGVGRLWVLWFVPPLAVALTWGGVRWRAYQQRRTRELRRDRAILTARERLSRALDLPDESASAMIERAVWGYFADKLMRESLDADGLADAFTRHGIDATLSARVWAVLRHAQDVRYAPHGEVDRVTVVQRAGEILSAVEGAWQIFNA